ncbi:hypothetical protein IH982_02995 [Patescibacteria group bacterium]|nr:hypothetical protein [Patescibacteria group bacterium]
MTKPLFSKSIRKHIRFQKAHIRREILDFKKQQELIQELYQRFVRKPEKKEEKVKEEPASSAGVQKRRKKEAEAVVK